MSVIEGGFNKGTVVLHAFGKRALVLRSRGAVERSKFVGEPLNMSRIDGKLHIFSTSWLPATLRALLERLGLSSSSQLVQNDPRIEGYDFLVVAPKAVTVEVASAKELTERWID